VEQGNPEGVDVESKGQPEGLDDGLGSLDVSPGGLAGGEVGEQDNAAPVVDGGDEGPLLLGEGGPSVGGSIMLDQSPDRGCEDLPIMNLPSPARFMASQLFRPVNDRVDRDIDPLFLEAIADGGVVVAGDRQVGVVDETLLDQELLLEDHLRFGQDTLEGGPLVGDGVSLRGLTEDPPQVKEPGPTDAQRLLDLFPAHETLPVSLEQKGDLLVRKALVKLVQVSLRSEVVNELGIPPQDWRYGSVGGRERIAECSEELKRNG
jgi:hypothetical protein